MFKLKKNKKTKTKLSNAMHILSGTIHCAIVYTVKSTYHERQLFILLIMVERAVDQNFHRYISQISQKDQTIVVLV